MKTNQKIKELERLMHENRNAEVSTRNPKTRWLLNCQHKIDMLELKKLRRYKIKHNQPVI